MVPRILFEKSNIIILIKNTVTDVYGLYARYSKTDCIFSFWRFCTFQRAIISRVHDGLIIFSFKLLTLCITLSLTEQSLLKNCLFDR